MDLEYLEAVRLYELEQVLPIFQAEQEKHPEGFSILEIGAGTGTQTKELRDRGVKVSPLDLENSNYSKNRILKITEYDGKNIPFDENTFDAVYSSNVLEHIPHLAEFHKEM